MDRIAYFLSLAFLYPLSWLPFPVLYRISDFLYFFLYRVFKYRIKTVRGNLALAFPALSANERKAIEKKFYKYFCDLILETVKCISISKSEMANRCRINDLEILDDYQAEKKSVVAVLGHYGNWEWAALSSALSVKQQMVVIYKPLSNPYFDKLLNRIRGRFGVKMVAMQDVLRYYYDNKEGVFVNCFVSDQSPSNHQQAIWTEFLGQETAVMPGAEKISRKFGHPVIFVSLIRTKRGQYDLHMKKLEENPELTPEDEITKMHTAELERYILEKPEFWLWSHKRWKRKRPK